VATRHILFCCLLHTLLLSTLNSLQGEEANGALAFGTESVTTATNLPPRCPSNIYRLSRHRDTNELGVSFARMGAAQGLNAVDPESFNIVLTFEGEIKTLGAVDSLYFPIFSNSEFRNITVEDRLALGQLIVHAHSSRRGLDLLLAALKSPPGLRGVAFNKSGGKPILLEGSAVAPWFVYARVNATPDGLIVSSDVEFPIHIDSVHWTPKGRPAVSITVGNLLPPHGTLKIWTPRPLPAKITDVSIAKSLVPSFKSDWRGCGATTEFSNSTGWCSRWQDISFALSKCGIPQGSNTKDVVGEALKVEYFGVRGFRFGVAGGAVCIDVPKRELRTPFESDSFTALRAMGGVNGCQGYAMEIDKDTVRIILAMNRWYLRYWRVGPIILVDDRDTIITSLTENSSGYDLDIDCEQSVPVGLSSLNCVGAEAKLLAKQEIAILQRDEICGYIQSVAGDTLKKRLTLLLANKDTLCKPSGLCEVYPFNCILSTTPRALRLRARR
jgi:hypothetical protein